MIRKLLTASSACFVGLTTPAFPLEYGNLDVVQNNDTNNGLDSPDPAVSVTIAPGSTDNFGFFGANRGDIDMDFGTDNDTGNGVMISSVRENGRDNSSAGDEPGKKYVTPLADTGAGGDPARFFMPLETAPDSQEWNINAAAAYFPFNEGWLGGHTDTSSGNNGGLQDIVTATSGISFGDTFIDDGGGVFQIDLTGLTSFDTQATAQNGVLLATGRKNEDNFALSRDNEDGTFTLILKDNGDNGEGSERDPVAFAYIPADHAGPDLLRATGRVQNDGSSEVSGGEYSVTKLQGPAGSADPVSAVSTTADMEANTSVSTTGDLTETSADVTVSDASGIEAGQGVSGAGIEVDTIVDAVNGTTITLSKPALSTESDVELTFSTTSADDTTLTVADSSGIQAGQRVSGAGVAEGTSVLSVTGTEVEISEPVMESGTGVDVEFATQGRWLLEIGGQDETTGTLIVTPCTGGANNLDNIVSYEWDGSLGAAGGWVVESRDIQGDGGDPVLEDGASADEDMFNFAFFTVNPDNPQPTVSITSPADGAAINAGTSVTITAEAGDTAPGTVDSVEFFVNGESVGTDTAAPYEYTTAVYEEPTNVFLEAAVIDNDGARAVSEPSYFSIVPAGGSGGLFFNGVDDYVDLGDPAELNLAAFTLETRFRRMGAGVAAGTGAGGVTAIPLVTKGRGEADQSNLDMNYFLGIRASDGVLAADFEDADLGTNAPIVGETPVELGTWHHAAVTFEEGTWSLYLDGNLEATLDTGDLRPRADSIQPAALASALNSLSEPAGFFHGYLDEARIWDRALSQSEVRARCDFEIVSESGLVARWGMDEGSGTTLTSTADGGLTGTTINDPVWVDGSTFSNNIKPDVAVTAPAEGDRFFAGDPITLEAAASDPDGSITEVRFYDNGDLVGTDGSAPFELTYTGAPLGGLHEITARATDDGGATSLSEGVVVDVTVAGPSLPGYSLGVIDGGDVDADSGTDPRDPANWVYESVTASPLAFDNPGDNKGDLAISIDGTPVPFADGLLLATNYATADNDAAIDNILSPYENSEGNYVLSTEDNGNPGESNPGTPEESSRSSLGFLPFADGWIGAKCDDTGAIIESASNLPEGVTVTDIGNGEFAVSGLPVTGNLLVTPTGNGTDNVFSVGRDGADWIIRSLDNGQFRQNESFGFVYIPEATRQVFSGLVRNDGTLVALNDELSNIGGSVNAGTQGYEVTIGDGRVLNPSNSVMFVAADFDNGFAGDNIMSYSAVGDTFVVFSQDLPGLNSQFQRGGFRFMIAPLDPVERNGDEVSVIASDAEGTENSDDDIVFTFRRDGDTSSALTVGYAAGGSATPGDDYAALPGSVTIPAGSRTTEVTISLEGDTELEQTEDIILTLAPGAGYTVGRFNEARAEALNAAPVIPSTTLSFQEGIDGYTGQWGKRIGENDVNELGSNVAEYFLDGKPGSGSPDVNGIVRFENLIGSGENQIPAGAEVTDARLIMTTSTVGNAQTGGPFIIDRLLVGIDETTTWSELGFDDTNDFEGFEGVRGSSTGLPVAGFGGLDKGEIGEADVTPIVQAWTEGQPNHGFAIFTGGTTNGWSYNTVGNPNPDLRPRLEVTYTTLDVKEYVYEADLSAILNSRSLPEGATLDGSTIETQFLDLNDPNNGTTEALLRFPVEFGEGGEGNIPIGEEVVKAELLMVTNSPVFLGSGNAQTGGEYTIHQMVTDWDTSVKYGASGPVVGTNINDEAARFTGMGQGSTTYIEVTDVVRNWRAGADNFGLNVKPDTTDGWQPFFPGIANSAGQGDAAPRLRVQTAILDPSSFDSWASDNGIPGANFNEDADGDGITELVEYGLGLDPHTPERLPQPGPDFAISFAKGAEAAADPAVRYSIEISDDLANWEEITPTVNDASEISGRIPQGRGKMFGRLNVEYVPNP